MEIEPLFQIPLESVDNRRFGDVISAFLNSSDFFEFRFIVAYAKKSGLNRLGAPLSSFLAKGGVVLGVVGVDEITTKEVLETLKNFSPDSTIFNTASSNIEFHPKIYLFEGESKAKIVVGSANLTKRGLFKNIEFGSIISFDLDVDYDEEVYHEFKSVTSELLNVSNPNVQPINEEIISRLEDNDYLAAESYSSRRRPSTSSSESEDLEEVQELFPQMRTERTPPRTAIGDTERETEEADTFIMTLSSFDTSHRPGAPGTPEMLIPQDAVSFFPELTEEGNTEPEDVYFDVLLNLEVEQREAELRLWYYEGRSEYRFRVTEDVIEQTSPGGGDLLVVSKLPEDEDRLYEVTIVSQEDPQYDDFLDDCIHQVGNKKWGVR